MFHLRLATALSLLTPAVILSFQAKAGHELQNCYVERVPCGTPEQLAETIRRCLASPALCGAERPVPAMTSAARSTPVAGTPEPRWHPSDSAQAGGPSPAIFKSVERVARGLSLPEEIRDLRNSVPAEPTLVIRHLGLRPTSAAAIDLREGTPTVEDLVLALQP